MRLNFQQALHLKPPIILNVTRSPKPFSTLATIFYSAAVFGVLLYATKGYWATASRLESLWYPAQTANWVVTANMLVYDGIQGFPRSLREVVTLAFVEAEELPRECVAILRETLDFVSVNDDRAGAQVRAQLAVLLAETGSKGEAMSLVESIDDDAGIRFREAFRAIYGGDSAPDLDESTNNSPLNYIESSWPAWRFETRWQRATGVDVQWRDEWMEKRARQKAMIVLVASSLTLLIILVGLALLPWLLRWRPWKFFHVDCGNSFSFREGFGIFVRAELCGWLLVALCSLHPLTSKPGYLAFGVLTAIPFVLLLAHRHWRYGRGSLANFVGIPDHPRGWWPLLGAAVCILAADLAFAFVIHAGAVAAGQEGHWAEGLDETLLYDTWPNRIVMLVNSVLWAPVYEEFAFRGVLFPALRGRVGVFWAALGSSLLFSSLHFYGWEGFLSVAAFGFVNALVFHHSRSLVPCIIAHSLTNLLIFGTEVALLS